jgi:hypothetical protein
MIFTATRPKNHVRKLLCTYFPRCRRLLIPLARQSRFYGGGLQPGAFPLGPRFCQRSRRRSALFACGHHHLSGRLLPTVRWTMW